MDVRTACSRLFMGRPGPNLVGRSEADAKRSLSYWFLWKLNSCHGFQQKLPWGFINGLMVMILGVSSLLGPIYYPVENERNPPRGSRDMSIATCLVITLQVQIRILESNRCRNHVARVTSSRAWCQSHPVDRRQRAEHAKFWIFQIGPLLAEIQPILWNDISTSVHPVDRRQRAEHAKFWFFQIGPLLAEIRPILWNEVKVIDSL